MIEQQELEVNEAPPVKEKKQREKKIKEEPPPQPVAPKAIVIDSRGLVQAKDNSELLRYCGALVLSGAVPDRFDTPQKLFGALMFARNLGLPDTAIRQIANIKGTPSLFGDLPLALCQSSGEMSHFKEKWFDEKYNVISFENKNLEAECYGAVCFIGRNKEQPESFSFTISDAERAGLYPEKNQDKPWRKYTKMMLRYRARSMALKSVFADKINGVAIAEYDFDHLPEMKDVSESIDTNLAREVNDLFKGVKNEQAN